MAKKTFTATLVKPGARGTWTYFVVPFSVEEAFGSKARVKVKGTINGVSSSQFGSAKLRTAATG